VSGGLAKTGNKPDRFGFLGLKHACGTDQGGKVAMVGVPCIKSRVLAKSKEWLRLHRDWKRQDQQKQLTMMLRGFDQYLGLHHGKLKLEGVRLKVSRQWGYSLR